MKSTNRLLLCVFALLVALQSCIEVLPEPENQELATERNWFRDSQGRAVILHGSNDTGSAKEWGPGTDGIPDLLTEEWVDRRVYKWGWNSVRYLIHWARVEPQKGVYDYDYLDLVAERVRWYRERGAVVIIDFHQDLYGYFFSNGNGAPPWATETDGLQVAEFGGDYWWLGYIDSAITRAYDNFWAYDKYKYLQDHYIKAAQVVAEYFKDDPGVFGYDVMNEPYGGSLAKTYYPYFESQELTAFYNRLIPALREVDPDRYFLFEPQSFAVNFGRESMIGAVVDPRKDGQKLGFAPHIYPINFHEGNGLKASDRQQIDLWLQNRQLDLAKHDVPMYVGEFGGPDDQEGGMEYYTSMMNSFDQMGASWALWDGGDHGSWNPTDHGAETAKMQVLVRTYPWAVAGTPDYFKFDVDTGAFELKYENHEGTSGPTVIHIAQRHYPNGWDIEVSDNADTWRQEYEEERSLLSIWHDQQTDSHTIKIFRK